MFLSRLVLNPRSRNVRNDLSDCQQLHCKVLSAFPQFADKTTDDSSGARAQFGVLFRVDTGRRSGKVTLLVQSRIEPDWSRLPEDYLLDDFAELPNPALKRVDEAYGALQAGMRLRFRLRANPTRRVSQKSAGEKSNGYGKRVELYREEDQIAWLERKGKGGLEKSLPSCGFRLLSAQVNPDGANVQAGPEGKIFIRKKQMTFNSVLFEGELEITSADDFRKALVQGIGSGKAYGFGLLSIAPARS